MLISSYFCAKDDEFERVSGSRLPIGRKKQPPLTGRLLFFSGANERTRTADLRITSALLYQLSHIGKSAAF